MKTQRQKFGELELIAGMNYIPGTCLRAKRANERSELAGPKGPPQPLLLYKYINIYTVLVIMNLGREGGGIDQTRLTKLNAVTLYFHELEVFQIWGSESQQ